MKLTSILLCILLIGCSKPIECENNTITINNTINNTIYINKTIPCNKTIKYISNCSNRELELIRRISFLEGQQDKYFNDSECNWELNKTNKSLEECNEKLCDYDVDMC